jgi:lysophospholipase L1-like esterase
MMAGVSVGAAAACTPWPTSPERIPDARIQGAITFVALGASDAAGVGVDRPGVDGWVPVLGRLLPQPVRVVNLGIPGIRLREAAIVQIGPALEAKPNLITLWLVVNDILNNVSIEAYKTDLEALLSRLKSEAVAEIAVGNVPDAPDGSGYLGLPDGPRRQVATRWNGVIGETVARHGVTLIDLYTKWPVRANPSFIGPDGLHPTVAGYRSLAQVVRDTLREAKVV